MMETPHIAHITARFTEAMRACVMAMLILIQYCATIKES